MNPAELSAALRSLGLLYGAGPLDDSQAGGDPAESIRAYIRRERPHLLQSYDLEALVALVLKAREDGAEAPASIETRRNA